MLDIKPTYRRSLDKSQSMIVTANDVQVGAVIECTDKRKTANVIITHRTRDCTFTRVRFVLQNDSTGVEIETYLTDFLNYATRLIEAKQQTN